MTRKDYVKLAEDFRSARPHDIEGVEMQRGFDLAVEVVMDLLQADNERFNRQRFLRACQPVVEQAQLRS